MCYEPRKVVLKRKDASGVLRYDGVAVVPCGRCLACLKAYSNEWAYRCMLEASQYAENCFVTLTYNDSYLPQNGTLVRKDLQDFLKRLRKKYQNSKIRYFYCGEYGSKGLRPHYHIMLFGFNFSDRFAFQKDKKGNLLYRSPSLEKLWPFGYSSIGELTFDSAVYCAKYLQKLSPPLPGNVLPFTGMSTHPGLGAFAINPNYLFENIYVKGKRIRLPKYFKDELMEGHDFSPIATANKENADFRTLISDPYLTKCRERYAEIFERISKKVLT